MSNLCYNCGSCHLPQVCAAPLNCCEICNNDGHFWYFCYLGARQRVPNFNYFALCANCNIWHLPLPCNSPAVKCVQCGNYGHLGTFCPVSALPFLPNSTGLIAPREPAKVGNKRQRTAEEVRVDVATLQISAEQIQAIRFQAAKETMELLKTTGEPQRVLEIMAVAPVLPPILAQFIHGGAKGEGEGSVVNTGNGGTSQNLVEYATPHGDEKVAIPTMLPAAVLPSIATPPTTASTTRLDTFLPSGGLAGGNHGATQNLFDLGGLADAASIEGNNGNGAVVDPTQTVQFGAANDTYGVSGIQPFAMPMGFGVDGQQQNLQGTTQSVTSQSATSQPTISQQGTPRPIKKMRRPSRPRCDECKRRCTHIVPDDPPESLAGSVDGAQEQSFEEVEAHGNDARVEWFKDAAEKGRS
ncbi:hypothetical protein LTR08_002277 [Meristemomyces frigidus]|nr:hypothetical protein LTR08_002277 [Meristemomyces frigidus]